MARNTHFTRNVFHSKEDGTTEHRDVKFTLDATSAVFSAPLPAYAAKTLGTDAVEATSLAGASTAYETAMGDYSRKRLLANGEPVLLVMAELNYLDDGYKSLVMGIEKARRAGNRYYGANGVLLQSLGCITLPDTPEHWEHAQRLISSLETAHEALMAAGQAADPVAAFMALGSNWQAPKAEPLVAEPVQPVLPFDTPADDEEL